MDKVLQKIANILTMNVYNMNNTGLLEGKMGIILFYYSYGRYSKNDAYVEIADELLEQITDNLKTTLNVSFDQGAVGIAWGIRYLIRNKFVSGDPEEILSDIEDILLTKYVDDSKSQIPLSTIGMYLHSMLIDNLNIEKSKKLIEIILKKYDLYFLCLSNNPKSIVYINSALHLFSIINERFSEYEMWIDRILFKILLYLSNVESLDKIDLNELKTLCKLIEALPFLSDEKDLFIGKVSSLHSNVRSNNIPIKYFWHRFLYFPDENVCANIDEINQFIDDNYTFLPKENTLSIYNGGLASIGIILINQGKAI